MFFKRGVDHDEDDEHEEDLQGLWRAAYVAPVVVAALRVRWIVVETTMRMIESCGLGLLELLDPRLISDEGGGSLGEDDHA